MKEFISKFTLSFLDSILGFLCDSLMFWFFYLVSYTVLCYILQQFQHSNTQKQNKQCLRNFDLSEYRQVLSDIAVWIYQGVIRVIEEKVQPAVGKYDDAIWYCSRETVSLLWVKKWLTHLTALLCKHNLC